MRLQNDFFFAHAAPAAGMALPGLHKIDRTFVFRTPRAFHHSILGLVDLYETSGRQNRVHSEIVSAYVAIREIAVGKLGEVGQGDQSPLFDHAAKVGGATFVKARIETHWDMDRGQPSQRVRNM